MVSRVAVVVLLVAGAAADVPLHNREEMDVKLDECFRRLFTPQLSSTFTPDEIGLYFAHFKRHAIDALPPSTIGAGKHNFLTDESLQAICEAAFSEARPASYEAMARQINTQHDTTWVAENPPRFRQMSVKDARRLMGTFVGDQYIHLQEKKPTVPVDRDALPESFDARERWPECKDVIGHVRDQAECGSCWAFASTEAFNDRMCIKTNGSFQTLLSPQDTTSCCDESHCFSFGCDGGQPALAWQWFTEVGVVSGGDYGDIGTGDTCWPYQLPMCSHHVKGPYPACNGEQSTPKCMAKCSETNYTEQFNQDRHKAYEAFTLFDVDEAKREIMENGPITGAFSVYSDFLTYKSGVYQHVKGRMLGGHAIKILGWGVEDGVEYWLVLNSWNDTWGDKGYFKIKMGDCGINDMLSTGHVSANTPTPQHQQQQPRMRTSGHRQPADTHHDVTLINA
ncbi:unnamed protein product [Vitrella brassicaformis CCMP3155]|uniref:Peptidase C1A papain C-terminal domain-containing protein n=2 Tax=Vitrella brassicaformis TaxID=1169539 RepID=A0A0G4FWR5_VITBC|nr:unnamed protein product [Vitrella brassicaformis CCMP3155]|eukprot:CEM19676.1 unnamed protein product [Vitrella brassicaformis CCMP3155]